MPKCNETGCPVLTNGRCINNFLDLKQCPHYSADSDDDNGGDSDNEEYNEPEDVTVHRGKLLSFPGLNEIAFHNYTRLIILAGMHDVGKTTALLSLMHLLETKDDYCDYVFSGSQTLVDFEEKAWPSKVASGNSEADTTRTTHYLYADLKFMHLQLAKKDMLNVKKDFLFTDVSGELFRNIRNTKKDAQEFLIGRRADHFALFLDAGALSSPQKKVGARNAALEILKSLTENGMLGQKTRLQIVYSRWDLLLDSANQETHKAYVDQITEELKALYGNSFEITIHYVASRPVSAMAEFGFGLEDLFKVWANCSRLDFNEAIVGEIQQRRNTSRHFSQYRFIK